MNYHVDKLPAQIWVNFDFKVKFDLEGQGGLPPRTIRALIKVFCSFGPNLVIVARLDPKLSCAQTKGWRMHRRRQQQYLKAKTSLGKKWYTNLKTWVQKNNMYMNPAVSEMLFVVSLI